MTKLFYNKIRKYGFGVAVMVVLVIQILTNVGVDYPPSMSQQNWLFEYLWVGRVVSLLLFLFVVFFFARKLTSDGFGLGAKLFAILLVASPFFSGLWLYNFDELIRLMTISGLFLIFEDKLIDKSKLIGGLFLLVIILLVEGRGLPRVLEDIRLDNLTRQVNEKILREDDLADKVELPLWFRRVAYNKISFGLRNFLKEFISFWSIEDVFFQEFSPGSKKGLVPFFWISVIPFITGIYCLGKTDNHTQWWIFKLLIVSWIYYAFSSGKDNFRWSLGYVWCGMVIGIGMEAIKSWKWALLVGIMFFYGWQANIYDFTKRPDFWLDNRPIVYREIYKTIKTIDNQKNIVVSNRLGGADWFCYYYLKSRCGQRMTFEGFDLKKTKAMSNTLYFGFIGEFVGSDINNKFNEDSFNQLLVSGYKVLRIVKVRDSVAWGYGNEVLMAEKL